MSNQMLQTNHIRDPIGREVRYTYNLQGFLESVTDPQGGITRYAYDQRGGAKRGQAALLRMSTYDAAGNMIQTGGLWARSGLPQAVTSATYNAANQLTNWGTTNLTYDANGNMTSDGTNTYTWNARNRLASMTGASFMYDGLGRRVKKTIGASVTEFVYDGVNPVQEQSGTTPVANILAGLGIDEYLARTDSAGTSYFLPDALGSTIALTDATGTVQTEYTYESFGKTTFSGAASTNPFQYTGRENDGTGLYYYRARYYSPGMQRFVSEDPIRFAGGINLYAYVGNNPVNFIDPLGLWTFDFNAGGHIWFPSSAGAAGINFSSSWKPGGRIDDARYNGSKFEYTIGSLADVGVSAGVGGLSGRKDGKETTLSLGGSFMGKYGGVQLNFKNGNFDGISVGLGLGLSLPVNYTMPFEDFISGYRGR